MRHADGDAEKIRQVQTLLVQRERLEAQRVAEERKSARLGAARVAKAGGGGRGRSRN